MVCAINGQNGLGLLHENAVLAIMLELVALCGEMTVPRATGGEKARFVRS